MHSTTTWIHHGPVVSWDKLSIFFIFPFKQTNSAVVVLVTYRRDRHYFWFDAFLFGLPPVVVWPARLWMMYCLRSARRVLSKRPTDRVCVPIDTAQSWPAIVISPSCLSRYLSIERKRKQASIHLCNWSLPSFILCFILLFFYCAGKCLLVAIVRHPWMPPSYSSVPS